MAGRRRRLCRILRRLPVGAPRAGDFITASVASQAPLVRLGVVGDVGKRRGLAARTARAMAAAAATRPFDALVLLGDNVYPDGDPDGLDRAVFAPFAPLLSAGSRLLPVLGNHDVANGHGDAQARRLGMPDRWYSARLGPVLFVGLDSNRPMDPDQRSWLSRTLAGTDAPWKLAALHHPPYSGGWHGSEISVRDAFCPAFERFGVQLVLSGHEHDYQRSHPIEGTTYVVSGGAAHVRRTDRAAFTDTAFSTHHFTDLQVTADHLVVRAVDHKGRVFDEVRLGRS